MVTQTKIYETRLRLDLTGCNGKNFTRLHCNEFCLFDLLEDPCETENIRSEQAEVFEALRGKLAEFWGAVVPHEIGEPQELADPKRYNNTWVPWLDETY